MMGWIGKESALAPLPDQDLEGYLESVFSSRFFAGARKREESLRWVESRFPAWPEEARRQADLLLVTLDAGKRELRPRRLSWKGLWRRNGSGKGASSSAAARREAPDQALLSLAKGYWYTGDARYRDVLLSEASALLPARSWVKSRRPSLPLWKAVWVVRLASAEGPSPAATRLWRRLVLLAGREGAGIETPAERGLFLLMMGILFGECREARAWKTQGLKLMERELLRRVGADGICRSRRLPEQIVLLSLSLQALLIGRPSESFPKPVEERVERMLEALSVHREIPLLEPGFATAPFLFAPAEARPIETLLGVGAIVFGRSDWTRADDPISEEAFFLTGPAGETVRRSAASPAGSKVFEEAGYAVLRSGAPNEKTLLLRSLFPAVGSKRENETPFALSMVAPRHLFLKDPSMVVRREGAVPPPPGRSLRHSFSSNGGTKLLWNRTFLGEEIDYLEGEQPIDRREVNGRHKRSVLFVRPDYWIIQDAFSGEGSLSADWRFPFPPKAKIEGNLADGFHISTPDGRLWMAALGSALTGVDTRMQQSDKEVVIRSAGPLPLSITTLLYPSGAPAAGVNGGSKAAPAGRHDFKSLCFPSMEGGTAFEVLTETCTDTLLWSPSGRRFSLPSIRFEGELLFVRRDYFGEISRVFALSAHACFWEGKRLFESAQPVPFLELAYFGETLGVRGAFSAPIVLYAEGVEEVRVNGEKTYFTRDRDQLILHF